MKKIYIKPETFAVALGIEKMVCTSGDFTETQIQNSSDFGAREVIKTPDAWEEW